MFNLANGVTWAKEDTIFKYKIGVFSSQRIYDKLKDIVKQGGRKINGKEVQVIRFRRRSDIIYTHVLYVSNNENPYIETVFEKVKGKNTLMFSDQAENKKYTVINLSPLSGKNFEINTDNAKLQKLIISEQILKLGGSEDVLRDIANQTQKKLQKERKILEEIRLQIAEQQRKLDEKEQEIAAEIKKSNQKQAQLELKEQEIRIKNMNMDTMKREAERQRDQLLENLKVRNKLNIQIKEQKEEKKKRELEKIAFDKDFKVKQDELKEIEKNLEEARETISGKDETIEEKNFIIYGFIGLLAIIVFLGFMTLRAYYKKQKINKKLNEQNIAINLQKDEIIAQSKQLELVNSELEKLSIVAGKTDNAVTIMDAEGNFIWVNAGFTRLYGYTLQLLKNERDGNIIKASSNTEIEEIIHKCIREKESTMYEELNTTRDGNKLWVQTTVTPILNEDEEVVMLVSIDTDISKVKNAEKEIRDQHKMIIGQARELEKQNKELEKLSLVASETDNAILMTDEKGNFTWVNDAYTRMFGFTFDYLVNNISKNIIGPGTEPHIKNLIENCIKNKETVDYEFQVKTKNGKPIWIHTTLTPILNGNGKVKNLIAIDTNISKLKKAEFEIIQKSEELQAQQDELRQQNQRIEFQNKHIRASITYAQNIQNAILPEKFEMDRFFKSFVIFRPKDIVSGDFYWFVHLPAVDGYTEKIFIAAVDCTGHGVPGAFMSMIGNRLLKEIVLEQKIVSPRAILEKLDFKVKEALRQDRTDNNDGMDLCLCRIENNKDNSFTVKFSGAKRPLFYYQVGDMEVKALHPDRRSIGGISKKRFKSDFTNQEITLNKGDIIWLSTDGIVDQNDIRRKRLGTPRFVEALTKIASKSLIEQKEFLIDEIDQYQGSEEQRDDITVIGMKLTNNWDK